jgi:hypothetical protein
MSRARCNAGIVVLIGLIAMAPPLWAQSSGAIQGNITDAQGAVVPGATVIVRNLATGIERSLVSDAAGDYLAPSLAPGRYRIEAHLPGFQDQAREIDVDVARTVVVNIRLMVGGLAEAVSVTGSTPVIDTATTSVGRSDLSF